MNSTTKAFPLALKNIDKFNRRLPIKVDREQEGLAKKFRKPRNDNPFRALEGLYEYLDRFFSYANGLVACSKGCSYCCHSEIGLSQVEADYIASKIGVPAKRLMMDLTRKGRAPWVDPDRPCPFLHESSCLIYAYRPMTCRTHVNFEPTNELCRFGSNAESMPLLDRKKSLAGAMKAYGEIAAGHVGRVGDIRDFFGNSALGKQALMRIKIEREK